jgi:hypothetical protein
MKNQFKVLSLTIFSILIIAELFHSCKKDLALNPKPVLNLPVNYLCTGNGALTYMPLSLGNKWEFSNHLTSEVTGSTSLAGKTYFEITTYDSYSNPFSPYYLRIENNGDLYEYSSTYGDYLEIPANPSLGQIIPFPGSLGGYKKVIGVDTTASTPNCNYTGLLALASYDKRDSCYYIGYYKKGLGHVLSQGGQIFLTGVTLK